MLDRGDGTYLLNPVWDEFTHFIGDGMWTARNEYVENALDWRGKVDSKSVVKSPFNEESQKYQLTLGTTIPLNLFKDKDNEKLYALTQAIVRAEKGSIIEMNYKYYDRTKYQEVPVTWEWGRVAGVGIDNRTEAKHCLWNCEQQRARRFPQTKRQRRMGQAGGTYSTQPGICRHDRH